MQLDAKALETAARYAGEDIEAARDLITAYLAALEPEDGLEVRVCVGVNPENEAIGLVNSKRDDDELCEKIHDWRARPVQFRWVTATVTPWQQPEEPETRGREVK
jgi:hypothetical protein